jgi:hypothetical protein
MEESTSINKKTKVIIKKKNLFKKKLDMEKNLLPRLWSYLLRHHSLVLDPLPEDLRNERILINRLCTGCKNCGHVEVHSYFTQDGVRQYKIILRQFFTRLAIEPIISTLYERVYELVKDEPVVEYNWHKHVLLCAKRDYCYCLEDDCFHVRPCPIHKN